MIIITKKNIRPIWDWDWNWDTIENGVFCQINDKFGMLVYNQVWSRAFDPILHQVYDQVRNNIYVNNNDKRY